jgi:hypothetical protein
MNDSGRDDLAQAGALLTPHVKAASLEMMQQLDRISRKHKLTPDQSVAAFALGIAGNTDSVRNRFLWLVTAFSVALEKLQAGKVIAKGKERDHG